jgi:hypothetical protein
MKASKELQHKVRGALIGLDTRERRGEYQRRELSDQRYRWDLLWTAVDRGRFNLDDAYDEGLHDSHIETVLKSIVPSIYRAEES